VKSVHFFCSYMGPGVETSTYIIYAVVAITNGSKEGLWNPSKEVYA
jgi:hypothetical protein